MRKWFEKIGYFLACGIAGLATLFLATSVVGISVLAACMVIDMLTGINIVELYIKPLFGA